MFNKFKKRIYKVSLKGVEVTDPCLDNGMDVLVMVDTTGSMGGLITDLQNSTDPGEPNNWLDTIVDKSLGDYRLSLIGFKDTYTTHVTQTSDVSVFKSALDTLTSVDGNIFREAYQDVIEDLIDTPSTFFRIGDSTAKFIIIITDAPPWGEVGGVGSGVYDENEPYSTYMQILGAGLQGTTQARIIAVGIDINSEPNDSERDAALTDLTDNDRGVYIKVDLPSEASEEIVNSLLTLCEQEE